MAEAETCSGETGFYHGLCACQQTEMNRLEQENAALRKELAEAKEISENCCKPAMQKVVELEAERDRLRADLVKYGKHLSTRESGVIYPCVPNTCTCGLDTATRAVLERDV